MTHRVARGDHYRGRPYLIRPLASIEEGAGSRKRLPTCPNVAQRVPTGDKPGKNPGRSTGKPRGPIAQNSPGVDIECHTVTRLVEKALEALDDGRVDKVKDILKVISETAVKEGDFP
jgi:hypothetical protein